MTGHGVHDAEMPSRPDLDERTVEAFLTGRSAAAADVGSLAAFAEDLRVAVSGPPPAPTPQLARLLTEGFSIDEGELPATAAGATRPRRPAAVPARRRRPTMTITQLLAAVAAKLAGLGVAAKAALGVGLATASVATAGVAGVLPDPAQHAVASIVETATPFQISDGTDAGDATEAILDGTGSDVPVVDDVTGTDDGTGTGNDTGDTADDDDAATNHGACVSAVAKNAPRGPGGVHGQAVSAAAKACPKSGDDGTATTTTSTTTSTTVVPGGEGLSAVDGDTRSRTPGNGGDGPGQSGGNRGKSSQSPGNSGPHGR